MNCKYVLLGFGVGVFILFPLVLVDWEMLNVTEVEVECGGSV